MKKHYLLYAMSLSLLVLLALTPSCKKETEETKNNQTPVKALNKTTFAPKKWHTEGSSIIHDFKAGGAYNTNGTWKWKSADSDTLEIVTTNGNPETYWKVYWNTETEMECEKIGTFTKLLYKDKAW